MQRPNQAHLRINLAELKAQLAKRLGPDRSKLYFHYLNKLLSLKLSKVEFNKFCLRVIGRENVKLHNKLIHSILENACKANVPPLASTQDENGFEITSGGYDEQNGESRSGISVGSDGDFSVVSSSHQSEVLFVGDGKEPFTRSSIQPPLGIPFCSDSVGGARQAPHVARGGRCYSSYDTGRLLDTEMLKERMQEIVVAHGLEGVSVDCASLLNNGLHVYLKRLIKSSVELVGIRSGHHDLMGSNVHKHHSYVKPVNGGFPGYDFHISLPDFKVAMGLKPQQLGEDWPFKIYLRHVSAIRKLVVSSSSVIQLNSSNYDQNCNMAILYNATAKCEALDDCNKKITRRR
ncbi:hypothetical protein Q3G72_035300 [Acer saccharum]|nr:hypothetical protein Q3G72_035300 [Acer saccharum]